MPPHKRYPGRRYPNDPFDFFAGDFDPFADLDRFFAEICRSGKGISFEEMIEEVFGDKKGRGNRIVHGFSIEIRPDGKTRVREFGKRPSGRRGPLSMREHNPTADIIEGKDNVAVTVAIPGVEREDIDINVTGDALEITVKNPKRKYDEHLMLPCLVKPKTMKATYKNGVLDVIVKKRPTQRGQPNETQHPVA